jgi:acyl-CoA reductase-like NAD-dependent aldehyde dehydrogenase
MRALGLNNCSAVNDERAAAREKPYGGVKDSGIGREGPKFAFRDMTEERLLVMNI